MLLSDLIIIWNLYNYYQNILNGFSPRFVISMHIMNTCTTSRLMVQKLNCVDIVCSTYQNYTVWTLFFTSRFCMTAPKPDERWSSTGECRRGRTSFGSSACTRTCITARSACWSSWSGRTPHVTSLFFTNYFARERTPALGVQSRFAVFLLTGVNHKSRNSGKCHHLVRASKPFDHIWEFFFQV